MITYLKQRGEKLRRLLIGGFALSTMAFLFQACYGVSNELDIDDMLVMGKVVNAQGDSLPDVHFAIKVGTGIRSVTTNAQGKFEIFLPVSMSSHVMLEGERWANNAVAGIPIVKVDTVEHLTHKYTYRETLQLLLHAK